MTSKRTIFIAFPIGDTSVSNYFSALAYELVKRGYFLVLITPGKQISRVTTSGNPAIYTWPSIRPTKLKDAIFLAKLIRKYKPVLILANFAAVNISMIVSCMMKVPLRISTYHTAHNRYLKQSNLRKIKIVYQDLRKSLVYKFCSFVLPVSKAMAQEVEIIYHVPRRKIQFFYNALEDLRIPKSQPNFSQKTLLSVGSLVFGKGQDVLVKAIQLIRNEVPGLSIKFVGDGPYQLELEKLVESLNLKEIVHFSGRVTHSMVFRLMADAYAVIVPSRFEAFSYVIIESFSVGTPVIASSVGGIPEIIRDNVDGFLVPPENPEMLAEKIRELCENSSLHDSMQKECRSRFLNSFELEKAVNVESDWIDHQIIKIVDIKK